MQQAKSPVNFNLVPGGPLWQRVPSQDANGKPLADFMLLIPRFNQWPAVKQAAAIQAIDQSLAYFSERVVFADFNTKLNLLWISLSPEKGVMSALVDSLQAGVPEAVLVANQAEVMWGREKRERRRWRVFGLLAKK